jgi:hypothetical protein
LTSELVAERHELLNSGRFLSWVSKDGALRLVTVVMNRKGINNLGDLGNQRGSS